ncbi:hypothetical protein ACFYXS_37385 [Streptomyces sp. NPDC002574]|uniref:hypothetical protein n=1 Tax=Streptomyces sp. NPDC002574 TaxID=3364652 RepID=UPI00368C1ADE
MPASATNSLTVDKAYPSSGPEGIPHKKVGAALRTLDEARSALEILLSREHPDAAETTVYYPYPEDRSVVIAPDRPAS